VDEQSLFAEALERVDPQQRAAFLDEACRDDPALRQRMERLLAQHQHAGAFLEASPLAAALTIEEAVRERPGTVIGPYKLLEQIGEGGFGVVFMAEQAEPVRRKVALKVLKPGMDSRQVVARFEAERQALAIMDHPNIAKVYDGGAAPSGRPFFVMELVKGVPITGFCDQSHLTPRERLELFVTVCQAVQHAHQKGIIHRDLKPSNVLVTVHDTRPVVKVIDFGVAKALGQDLTDKTLFTGFAQMVGTPLYMSPEQAGQSGLDVDTRSDIYSLGVLLYELLTGTTPFRKERFKRAAYDEIRRIIREEEPPRPSTRLSESKDALPSISAQRHTEPEKLTKLVRGELDWIVMKCLEKDRSRRYETVSAFAADVQRYLSDEPVQACPPSARYRLRKFARRNRGPLLAALAVAGLLVLGTVGTSVGLVRALEAEGVAGAAAAAEAEQRKAAETQRDRAIAAEGRALAEKQRADDEAAAARAVNEFLQKDLLSQADIGNQAEDAVRDSNVTVRELLDRAARKIEGKFVGQEVTEAGIRLTLGDAYMALGKYDEARKHLECSLALRRRKLGADNAETLTSMHHLAAVYSKRGEYVEAEQLYKEALEGRRTKLGADHPDTLESMIALAGLYWLRGRHDEAERLHKQALEACRSKLGGDHPLTLFSMHNLAAHYQRRGRLDEAEALHKQALEACRSKLGAGHPLTLTSKNLLAVHYQMRGRYDDAASLHKEVLDARRAVLGADHPDTLQSMENLAAFYQARGRYDEAEALHKETLAGRRARLGADHPDTLHSIANLAALQEARGHDDEAERLFKQALVGYRARLGAEHPITITIRNRLAALYNAGGRHAEAEPLLREAVGEARKKKDRVDSSSESRALALLALNLLRQMKYADAEDFARESLAIRAREEPDAWTTFNARSLLGGALLGQKKYADAEPLLLAGYEGMKQRDATIPEVGKIRVTEALERLVQLYEAWDRPAQAKHWRKELEARKKTASMP
jgi:serine/threonine protein kinase/tetratricopeptide (TPR) repeat protein